MVGERILRVCHRGACSFFQEHTRTPGLPVYWPLNQGRSISDNRYQVILHLEDCLVLSVCCLWDVCGDCAPVGRCCSVQDRFRSYMWKKIVVLQDDDAVSL
jgi:hypothetical protein